MRLIGLAAALSCGSPAAPALTITPDGTYLGEVFTPLDSGDRRDVLVPTDLSGLLDVGLEVERATAGGTLRLRLSAVWSHGRSLSTTLGDVNVFSNIAARPTVRLYHARIDYERDDWRARVGELDFDADFMASEPALLFINSGFGPMATVTANMPVPTYPLTGLGATSTHELAGGRRLAVGLFDGDAGSEVGNSDGLGLGSTGVDGVAVFAEAMQPLTPGGLPGRLTLGGAWHSGQFELIDPGAAGRRAAGNGVIYAIWDQTLMAGDDLRVDGFLRVSGMTRGGVNAVPWQVDSGVTLLGPLPGREADTLGLALLVSGLAADVADGGERAEYVVELTYLAVVTEVFTLQPSIQWIRGPTLSRGNATVVAGVRIGLSF